jgi:hypothetical protein
VSPGYWSEGIQRCIDAGLVEEATIETPGMREAVAKAAERLAKAVDAEILRRLREDLGE